VGEDEEAGVAEKVTDDAFDDLLRDLARAPDRLVEPRSLLHYRVQRKIGEGGMGAVYEGWDEKLGRSVALKRVASSAHGDGRARLLREARAASSLNHPNIVTVYAIEEALGVHFIVMELAAGESLAAVLDRGALPFSRVLEVGIDVCEALECAHAAGVVHRDIKPANVILTTRGNAKVLDFGVAKLRPGHSGDPGGPPLSHTEPGTILGTLHYMAPEQIRGREVDGRADVFALGCLLYEAATGRMAFPGGEPAAILYNVTQVDPRAPSLVTPALPPAFDAVIARALAKDPAARFATAAELRRALLALRSSFDDHDGPASLRAEEMALLVGRDAQLTALEGALRRGAAGQGALVLVTGEAGQGKTALVDAVARHALASQHPPLVAHGRCLEQFGDGEAYFPVVDLLQDLLGGPMGARVRESLHAVAPTWALRLHAATETGVRTEMERVSLGATKARMLRELGDALFAIAAMTPLLLVLEDVHWADPSTAEAIRHLVPRLPKHRVVVVATARGSEVEASGHPLRGPLAEWRARRVVEEVPVRELSAEDVARWVDARFGPNDFERALAVSVHARTEGRPLFVASMLDFLMAEGHLRHDATGWHAGQVDVTALGMPDNVREMLRVRVDLLSDEDRELLVGAAAQGTELLGVVTSDALGIDDLTVDARFARIARAHRLLRRMGDEELPDGTLATRWRFAHALYRDVLYEELAGRRRSLVHLAIGNSLEKRYGERVTAIAPSLAVHFVEGRDLARATRYLAQAGDNAMSVFAAVEAERYYEHALGIVARLPDPERDRTAFELQRKRALALQAMSRYDAAGEALTAALAHARACEDVALEGAAHVSLAEGNLTAHRLAEARPHAEQALTIAERDALGDLRVDALAALALERLLVGDLETCAARLSEIPSQPPLVGHLRGLLHYFRSEYADAERAFARAAADNEAALADGLLLMESRMFGALAIGNLGRLGEALASLNATLALAERNDSLVMRGRLGNSVGWVYRELGMPERALEYDLAAAAAGREAEESEAEGNALVNLGEDRLELGLIPLASESFPRVVELARGDDWVAWRYQLRLRAARARVALAQADLGAAEQEGAALLAEATTQGAGKYVAIAHELRARVATARGDVAQALREVDCAYAALAAKPCPLVEWKVEALASQLARARGDQAAAARAETRMDATAGVIAAGLAPPERHAFLAQVARVAATAAR
jgi:tetratricopeptide (TPR) repeat protein